MTVYATEDIRNIAIVGHAGSGKTTLTEALLFEAGASTSKGSVEKGNTVSDFDALEQQAQHSLSTALVNLDYQGKHINIIDIPGYPDFLGQTLSVLPAVETVALVINAQNGIESNTRRLMDWAEDHHFCHMIIINKIDAEDHDLPKLLDQIQESFGKQCLPINLPAKGHKGIVDCFFKPSGEAEFSSMSEAHTALVDQVVEVDEKLMELYLEQGEVSPEQLHDPFEEALRDDHLVPVCFVSARDGTGVKELLEIFAKLMPNPTEGTAHPLIDEDHDSTLDPDPKKGKHVLAHVFKVSYDPFVGKLAMFRIYQGKITKDSQLFIDDQPKPFKVGHLFRVQGKDYAETNVGVAGDICAIAKIDDVHIDAILHDSHDEDHVHAPDADVPKPMAGVAIDAKSRGDEQKIADALEKLAAEDPCLEVEQNVNTNETILRGLGDLHLRIALERIKERYNVEVDTHTPTIAYRETINAPAEGHYRHKKQTGGAGQFGEVFLRIEPLPRDSGFEFVNKVVGGVIPGGLIPAVEKGVRQAIAKGALAGFSIQDVRVTVYDGKHHSVDSNEVSFVTAGRKAFLSACAKAKPMVLEPIVRIDVTAPSSNMGDISGDLASRRGRINDTENLSNGMIKVNAQVPLAELTNYQSRLKSMTGGEGAFSMELASYEPVPAETQKKLAAGFKGESV